MAIPLSKSSRFAALCALLILNGFRIVVQRTRAEDHLQRCYSVAEEPLLAEAIAAIPRSQRSPRDDRRLSTEPRRRREQPLPPTTKQCPTGNALASGVGPVKPVGPAKAKTAPTRRHSDESLGDRQTPPPRVIETRSPRPPRRSSDARGRRRTGESSAWSSSPRVPHAMETARSSPARSR